MLLRYEQKKVGLNMDILFAVLGKEPPLNRRELDSSLLLQNYADAHTQHNKKVDWHQKRLNELIDIS